MGVLLNSHTHFEALNDDCILKLLDWLSLSDMCSMNRTCKRIQALSENCFLRKHFTEFMTICRKDTDIALLPEDCYIKYFSKCVRNVIVRGLSSATKDDELIRCLKSKCNQNVRELRFEYITLNKEHGGYIQNILENVEIIVFRWCTIDGSIYHSLLKYCRRLKQLIIFRTHIDYEENKFFDDCPLLENFQLTLRRKDDCIFWNHFLESNANVTHLKQVYLEGDHPYMQQMTKVLVDRAKSLEYLWLSVSEDFVLNSCEGELKLLDSSNKFKCLEMEFDGMHTHTLIQNINKFTALQSLTGLFFDVVDVNREFMSALCSLRNLRTLHMECPKVDDEFSEISRKHFPISIKRLYVGNFDKCLPIDQLLLHFIGCSSKLNEIILYETESYSFLAENISLYNLERTNLPTPSLLRIHIEINVKKNFSCPNTDLIHVMPLSSIKRYLFYASSPFIRFSIPS